MTCFSSLFLRLTPLFIIWQFLLVSAELSDGVYLVSQKPPVQLGNTTYYLSLSGLSEKVQLQTLQEGSAAQMWEITNTAKGVTLKNMAFDCYGYVGSLWQILPIGAPLFCSNNNAPAPQIFQPRQNEDGTHLITHFNSSDPSLFWLMHTVPLDLTLGKQKVYGNITFVPLATSFATSFWFERVDDLRE
ncbi:hypothetical protein ACGC1H_003208 [Rhizoctonia solani]|uniref:Ricin B lectin domain-containing protein n=1 Tax=Rhizoctonia solani TaxID=456999 RepID=A0A8H3BIR4_9AGAM|nr:unnamed protein product [Rhizoctonia solani]